MVTRRGFLQALMGIPAIAALPAIGQVVEALPLVEAVDESLELRRSEAIVEVTKEFLETSGPARWLYLNEHPIDCKNVVMEAQQPVVSYLNRGMVKYDLGLPEYTVEVELYYNPLIEELMCHHDKVKLVAHFGDHVLTADARLSDFAIEMPLNEPITQKFTALLLDVQWHG